MAGVADHAWTMVEFVEMLEREERLLGWAAHELQAGGVEKGEVNRVSWGAMRPRLLPTFALCSLACSVALAGLLAWSWGRCLYIRHVDRAAPRTMTVECQEGIASALLWHGAPGHISGVEASVGPSQSPRVAMWERLRAAVAGFELYRGPIGSRYAVVVACPLWVPVLLTALPPAAWAWRRRRRGRRGFDVEVAAERDAKIDL